MIRSNTITGEPVIIAPNRAGRPGDDALCPFCPGNESHTPPTIAAVGDPWRIRVFANKYPATEHHEVIVESNRHDATLGEEEVVRVYADRYRALRETSAYVALFKNHGPAAGATLSHIHSQVIGVPFIPPRIARESAALAEHCALCVRPADELLIAETDRFLAYAPFASAFAYQQWIVPKRHVNELSHLDESELSDLAKLLRSAAHAMLSVAASFNWTFLSFPAAGHFYVDAFPRLTTIAGFEIGTGTWIDVIDPIAAARRLRGAQ